mgnify:CR=1 FL=1
MATLFEIRKTRTVGTFAGRTRIIKEGFESIEDAGLYLIENNLDLFGPNIGMNHTGTGLTDLTVGVHEVIFEKGDRIIDDGDDRFEIIKQKN